MLIESHTQTHTHTDQFDDDMFRRERERERLTDLEKSMNEDIFGTIGRFSNPIARRCPPRP